MESCRRNRIRTAVPLVLAGVMLVGVGVHLAQADPRPKKEIALTIEGIPRRADLESPLPSDHPLLTEGGWSLTMTLKAKFDFAGFAAPDLGTPFQSGGGFVRWTSNGYYAYVFGDEENPYGEDHCPSWDGLAYYGNWEGCTRTDPIDPFDPTTWWPIDERVVPFGVGMSGPEDCDDTCDPSDPTCHPCEQRPVIETHVCTASLPDCNAAPTSAEIGPYFVGSIDDGHGWGHNPRLPGLVIVADAGPSIVTEPHATEHRPVRTDPLQCRNLAGFVQSVSYDLSDYAYDTSITAHLNVPHSLFSPVVLTDADEDYVDPESEGSCDYEQANPGNPVIDDSLVVIDGGEPVCLEGRVGSMSEIVGDQLITVRVFVVQVDETGRGPDTIEDTNGNGYCDVGDYEDMVAGGWNWNRGEPVLSEEVIYRFSLLYTGFRFAYANDLDGDGRIFYYVLPAGGGGLERPPR